MPLDVFLNFDGNCRDAVDFYTQVFSLPAPQILTYGQAPGGGMNEADNDRVLYTFLPIYGSTVMFSDCPSASPFVRGNNFGISVSDPDPEVLKRLYNALKQGGEVHMELGKTFFSELYAMVTDKFGTLWQLSIPSPH